MSSERWRETHRAWKRLGAWFDDRVVEAGSRDREPNALEALADVGHVRRVVDEVELRAVRSARVRGRSWAEIATHLGVTRQAAWERWRDLDDDRGADAPVPPEVRAAAADRRPTLGRSGRAPTTVPVPDVVGLALDAARARLLSRGLRAVGVDAAPLAPAGAVVTDQSPESGARIPPGAHVTLWLDTGEGGVREPRRPGPEPLVMSKHLPDPADDEEAVG